MCGKHYMRWLRHGNPEVLRRGGGDLCSIEGCAEPVKGRGWCSLHYERWRRNGDPEALRQWPHPENLLQRMEPQPNGCIYFTGHLNPDGYGMVWNGDREVPAHRAAYEHFVGPIPDGMTIDHECHNDSGCAITDASCPHRRCVNVEHLAVKPQRENSLASPNAIAHRRAAATHCKHGHEYDEKNTGRDPDGYRRCRACGRERQR